MIADCWYRDGATLDTLADAPTRLPLAFHRRLPDYAETPLLDLPDLAAALGLGRLWVKDESERLGLPSFKMLGAAWATYRALSQRLGSSPEPWQTIEDLQARVAPLRPLTLAAATDGNHGRAVARMARLLELAAHIFVPAGTAAARMQAIEGEGARLTVVQGTYDEAVVRAASEAGERCLVIADTSWQGYEEVPRWVIEGYSTIFWEIDAALDRLREPAPDVVVTPIGVGALAAAVVGYFRRPGLSGYPRIVGVEPERAACVLASMRAGHLVSVPGPHDSIMAGLNCGDPSPVAWPLVSTGIDLFLSIDDEAARQGMRDLASAGIVSGETGAAALGGLTSLLRDESAAALRADLGIGSGGRVLVLSTEGATDPEAYRQIVDVS